MAADEIVIRDHLARDGLLPAAARIRPTQRWRMRAGVGLRGLRSRWRRNAVPAHPPHRDAMNAELVDYQAVLGEWAGGRLLRRAE